MRRTSIAAGLLAVTAIGLGATQAFGQGSPGTGVVALDCPQEMIVTQITSFADALNSEAASPGEVADGLLDEPLLAPAIDDGAVDQEVVPVEGEPTDESQAAIYTDADGRVVGQVLLELDASGIWQPTVVEVCS